MTDEAKELFDEIKSALPYAKKLRKRILDKEFLAGLCVEDKFLVLTQYTAIETYLNVMRQSVWRHMALGNCTLTEYAGVDDDEVLFDDGINMSSKE